MEISTKGEPELALPTRGNPKWRYLPRGNPSLKCPTGETIGGDTNIRGKPTIAVDAKQGENPLRKCTPGGDTHEGETHHRGNSRWRCLAWGKL